MASGVNLKSLERFTKKYDDFKDMVLDESKSAIVKTREEFVLTVANMLGSVGPEGGVSTVIPSDYAVVWKELSKKWVGLKRRFGLQMNIGTAYGTSPPGLKGYLISLAKASPSVQRSGNEASLEWKLTAPSSPGGYTKGSANDPLWKLFSMEFGWKEANLPARPVWYPVLKWFQARAKMQDKLINAPYVAALQRAKAIIYG